jgi:hypothetical protein
MPICYDFTNSLNERQAFARLTPYLQPGDILIFDRGFFSEEMLNLCIDNGYYVVMRIPKSCKNIFSGKLVPTGCRRITYVIDKLEYVLLSNLPTSYSNEKLKAFYHDRWDIEEFYKVFKHSLGGSFYSYKNLESLQKRIELQFLTSVLIGLLHHLNNLVSKNDLKYRTSPLYTLEYLGNFIYNLLYHPKGYLTAFKRLLKHVWSTCYTMVRKPRSYPRKAIIYSRYKWYFS